MQIFVLGMHRSGTSALARILNLMGAHFGDGGVGIGANAENPKGFWERRDVRLVNDAMLFNAGCDWDCVSGFDAEAMPEGMSASHRATAAEIVLELDAHRPWFVKEPRLCLLFPLWRSVLEMPLAVHIHRNPLEVARSMERRNGLPVEVGLALWEAYNVQAVKGTRGVPRLFVAYEELMRDPLPAIESIREQVAELGGYRLRVPGKRELGFFLEDGLRHQRESDASLLEVAGDSQMALYEKLRAGDVPDAAELGADSLAVLREYEASVNVPERIAAANARKDENVALKIERAVKRTQLDHALEGEQDARERLQETQRKLGEALATSQRLDKDLALARREVRQLGQRIRDLNEASERERVTLREAHAERLTEAERKLDEALTTSRRLDKELALARRDVRQLGQRVRDADERQVRAARANAELAGRRSELVRQREALQEAYATRMRERDLVAQDRDSARQDMRRLKADMQRLADNHASLGEARESLAQEHAALQREHTALRGAHAGLARDAAVAKQERDRAVREGSALKAERDLLRLDQAELVHFSEALTDGFETTLTTRRWRLGHALLSLPRRVLFRPRQAMVTDAVRGLIGEHRQRRGEFEKRRATLRERRDANAKQEKDAPVVEVAEAAAAPARVEAPRPELRRTEPAAREPEPFRRGPARTVYDMLGMARNESVDVIVCVHNALDDVRLCLDSVVSRTTGNYRLVVVNDGSDEETSEYLQGVCASLPGALLIETHGPLGYTRAANAGLRASEADHAVLLNSDTVVPSLWLERMLACMNSDDSIGIVGPLSNAASWQSVPDVVEDGRWAVNELPPGYDVDVFAELVASLSRGSFPRVDFVNGFCFMIRRAVVDAIGLLDEERFPRGYGEENDYCLRAADAGFSLAVADQCYVFHGKSKSFGKAARDELARLGREALTAKHGQARIDDAAERLAATPALREMRERVAQAVAGEGVSGTPPVAGESLGVLFVMPVRGGAGGAHSVVQETMGMRRLGVDAAGGGG